MKAFICCALIIVIGCCAGFAQNPNEKYLAGDDVERAAGMKGVRLVPRGSVAGAGGDLNFADASGKMILMVQFTDAKNFEEFQKRYAKGTVPGIGDHAIVGAALPGFQENLLAFRKGTRCVVLTAFADFIKKRVYLSTDQLTALGKLIASRL